MSLPEFEFKPMTAHGAHERHHNSEEEENWLTDSEYDEDHHYYDPYGLVDYTYD